MEIKEVQLDHPKIDTIGHEKIFNSIFNISSKNKLNENVINRIHAAHRNEYPYWDKIKYLVHSESESEVFWGSIKLLREMTKKQTQIKSKNNKTFTYSKMLTIENTLKTIDFNRFIKKNFSLTDDQKNELIEKNCLAESIAAVRIEGVDISQTEARKLLRGQVSPNTMVEHLIVNMYQEMRAISINSSRGEMSIELLMNLHKNLLKKAVSEDDLGRFRTRDEHVVIMKNEKEIAFEPPDIDFIEDQIQGFCDYANNRDKSKDIHPVTKAILLHFWLIYLHPFKDGSVRIARVIFYCYLMKNGYEDFIQYISLSHAISKSQISYANAFIYSVQDDEDVSYFIDYNLKRIADAFSTFENNVKKEKEGSKEVIKYYQYNLNKRQLRFVKELENYPEVHGSITAYMALNKISRRTAEYDFRQLIDQKIITKEKTGRKVYFALSGTYANS